MMNWRLKVGISILLSPIVFLIGFLCYVSIRDRDPTPLVWLALSIFIFTGVRFCASGVNRE